MSNTQCDVCERWNDGCDCIVTVRRKGTPSPFLQLARLGALLWIPAELVTDEIRNELDEWSELGFVILECGCLWSMEDVGALACSEEPDCHPCKLPGHSP